MYTAYTIEELNLKIGDYAVVPRFEYVKTVEGNTLSCIGFTKIEIVFMSEISNDVFYKYVDDTTMKSKIHGNVFDISTRESLSKADKIKDHYFFKSKSSELEDEISSLIIQNIKKD